MNTESLKKRATKGVGYLALLNILEKGIALIRIAILARLLSPVDFGIFAFAIIVFKSLQTFTSFGTEKYLIQKDTLTAQVVGNAWTFNLFRGIGICLFTVALAPYYAIIIGEPHTKEVLYIIALSPFFDGMISPGKYLAERNLDFRRITIFELVISSIQTIIVIYLAYSFADVRALAWGMVATSIFRLFLSFIFFATPCLPKLQLGIFKEILSVGKHFLVIAIGTLIMTQADNLIVGTVMGASVLGIYALAYRLTEIPLNVLKRVVNRVALPIFSRIQSDKKQLSGVVEKVLQVQLAILIPIIIIMLILPKIIILTIYGDKWLKAVPVLQALGLVILGRGLSHVVVPYIIGTANFRFASRVKIVETVVFIIAVYFGTYYFGVTGAAFGAGAGYSVAAAVRIWFLCKHSNISFMDFINQIKGPVVCMTPGIISSLFILHIWDISPLLQLFGLSSLFGISYLLLSLIFQRQFISVLKASIVGIKR